MKFITKNDYYRERMKDLDCILAFESAAEYLGLSNGNLDQTVRVIADSPINIPSFECCLSNLDQIAYQNIKGINCTTVEQTLSDLLCDENRDPQILLESLSNYYFIHGESFDNLKLNPIAIERFNELKQDAIEYYND